MEHNGTYAAECSETVYLSVQKRRFTRILADDCANYLLLICVNLRNLCF